MSAPPGGLIFHDKGRASDGWRYLEAAPSDQSKGIQWYNGNYVTTEATATGIGSGKSNTATMISKQGAGSYAASLCDNRVVGAGGTGFLTRHLLLLDFEIRFVGAEVRPPDDAVPEAVAGFVV
jgi:hypothetical protein